VIYVMAIAYALGAAIILPSMTRNRPGGWKYWSLAILSMLAWPLVVLGIMFWQSRNMVSEQLDPHIGKLWD
jgi:hypothetical protein